MKMEFDALYGVTGSSGDAVACRGDGCAGKHWVVAKEREEQEGDKASAIVDEERSKLHSEVRLTHIHATSSGMFLVLGCGGINAQEEGRAKLWLTLLHVKIKEEAVRYW